MKKRHDNIAWLQQRLAALLPGGSGWRRAGVLATVLVFVISCANMGTPDGGWYDDTPPRVVKASPEDKATGVRQKKVTILFDEYIKLEDAQSKVIVSPPQLEQAEIAASGKRIVVQLKDSLKPNTTYTIDFSDGISDNNEGNPMGNYTYSFSTGDNIDTLEVSGYVLDAKNLEPVKGIQVGLYDNLSDTIFRTEPMVRISRTDSRGHFTVKGVAPGTYRCYALNDADGDYVYNQKSEMVAFSKEVFEPSFKPDTRQDTIWLDTLHIDRILKVPYTHFLPDDITLLAFTAVQDDRYLVKTERSEPNKLGLYFSYGDTEMPRLRGLNFNEQDAFALEPSLHNDTIFYWLRDTALVNQDTLRYELQYRATDSTGVLVVQTDTIEAVPKVPYARRQREMQKQIDQWKKEQEKLKKKGEPYDSIVPVETTFSLQTNVSGGMDPDRRVLMEMPAPLAKCDTSAIHLYVRQDTLWYREPFVYQPLKGYARGYELVAGWEPGREYSLEIDSCAFETIYGLASKAFKQGIKVKELAAYSSLVVTLSGIKDTGVVVQLVNASDAVVKQSRARGNVAEFYYIKPGKYYMRAYVDANGNNQWDTGDYDSGQQPEAVYYYHEEFECKEKWDVELSWNLTARKLFEQKPQALVKEKGTDKKKRQNRNLQRAKQLGIEYIQDKTGVKL